MSLDFLLFETNKGVNLSNFPLQSGILNLEKDEKQHSLRTDYEKIHTIPLSVS